MSTDQQKIAIYGKGGIGKSAIASNLSVCYAVDQELSVLHIGCDPKADSAVRLVDGTAQIQTVLDVLGKMHDLASAEHLINMGRHGIHACESGGPPAGLGCGGRGVARCLEFLEDIDLLEDGGYDVVIFDVLGDVVCGGFAAPLREGFGDKVCIVCNEEPMSVYAGNNIARAVKTYSRNGVVLAGIIANIRDNSAANPAFFDMVAERLNTKVIGHVPRDPLVMEAENNGLTVVEYAPDAPAAKALREIAVKILEIDRDSLPLPTPMEDVEFYKMMKEWEESEAASRGKGKLDLAVGS